MTFTFRDGAFDGKPKLYTPRGFVRDTQSNAIWGMQFIWPIKTDYRITYLAPDYSQTICQPLVCSAGAKCASASPAPYSVSANNNGTSAS